MLAPDFPICPCDGPGERWFDENFACPFAEDCGERGFVGKEERVGEAIVVEREVRLVVSSEGGGGRVDRIWGIERIVARHRKHSPVP